MWNYLFQIWNMSDPSGNGYLDKQGLFMALRLIAVCQAGKEPSLTNMTLSDPPPKLVGVETPPTVLSKVSESHIMVVVVTTPTHSFLPLPSGV